MGKEEGWIEHIKLWLRLIPTLPLILFIVIVRTLQYYSKQRHLAKGICAKQERAYVHKLKLWLKETKRIFWESPLDFFDEIHFPKIGGKTITWGLKDNRFRAFFLIFGVLSSVAWFMYGFDSTIHWFAKDVPFLADTLGYTQHEGAGLHWSTIQFYCFFFVAISYWLHKEGISETRNVLFTSLAMLFSVGVFEMIWMTLYDIIHFQDFALWAFGDGNVFWRNMAWLACLPLTYLVIRTGQRYVPKYNINFKFLALMFCFICGWLFWIYYPLPHIIFAEGGNVGSSLYPQTVYTCKDIMAQGGVSLEAEYIPDFWVHMTNIVVKYFGAFATLIFFKVKVVHKETGRRYKEQWQKRE